MKPDRELHNLQLIRWQVYCCLVKDRELLLCAYHLKRQLYSILLLMTSRYTNLNNACFSTCDITSSFMADILYGHVYVIKGSQFYYLKLAIHFHIYYVAVLYCGNHSMLYILQRACINSLMYIYVP